MAGCPNIYWLADWNCWKAQQHFDPRDVKASCKHSCENVDIYYTWESHTIARVWHCSIRFRFWNISWARVSPHLVRFHDPKLGNRLVLILLFSSLLFSIIFSLLFSIIFSIRWEDLLLGLVFGIWAIDYIKYKIPNSPSGEKIYCWVTFFVGNLCGIFFWIFLGQSGEEMYCWVTNFTIYDVAVFKGFNAFHVSL